MYDVTLSVIQSEQCYPDTNRQVHILLTLAAVTVATQSADWTTHTLKQCIHNHRSNGNMLPEHCIREYVLPSILF